MSDHVLITGGAGFIGSHVVGELLQHSYRVRILDKLSSQVHGPSRARPAHLSADVEFIEGDVRNPEVLGQALEGTTAVVHLAARVGIGQSMYRVADYTDDNCLGTAVLLEALSAHPVRRLVIASSMSVYGEGLYRTEDGRTVEDASRSLKSVRLGRFDIEDELGRPLVPVPTPEWKRCALESTYALSKYYQERLCLTVGRAYGIETVALRLFNVYGPHQSLDNPYTGVLAIFGACLRSERPAPIYEDGAQRRDFVSVHDAARAFRLALEQEGASGKAINVGSGRPHSIAEIEGLLRRALGREKRSPVYLGRGRVGDVRHCFADLDVARAVLGYEPQVSIEEGLAELAQWLERQAAGGRSAEAQADLDERGQSL